MNKWSSACVMVLLLISAPFFAMAKTTDERAELSFVIIKNQFSFNRATIKSASMEVNNGVYRGLHVELKPRMVREFERITRDSQGLMAGFILNGKVLSASVIRSPLSGNILVMIPKEDAEKFLSLLSQK